MTGISMRRRCGLLIAFLALFGCQAGPPVSEGIVYEPEVDSVATTDIGESMFITAKAMATPAVKLPEDVLVKAGPHEITVRSGVYRQLSADGKNPSFEEPVLTTRNPVTWVHGNFVKTTSGYLFHYSLYQENMNEKDHAVKEIGRRFAGFHKGDPGYYEDDLPLAKASRGTYMEYGVDSFKRELVYTGVAGSIVHILYREYYEGIARPAFSQELSYDISASHVIGFKGARFEILDANNLGIKFRVIKHLD